MEIGLILSKKIMLTSFVYPQVWHLWITSVEKSVENVEKCEFSTGILPLCNRSICCGKVCIQCCISAGKRKIAACYVNGR